MNQKQVIMQRFIQLTTPKRAKTNKIMKNFTLTLAALLFTLGSHATVITVDNNPNSPADYSDLQTAVDSSNSGDTLYIQGSPTSYGSVNILYHQLTLIGAGYNPPNQWGLKAKLDDIALSTSANGTKIIGLTVGRIESTFGDSPKNIYIARCIIIIPGTGSIFDFQGGEDSWLIENNVIDGTIYLDNNTNIIITNNLILGGEIRRSNKQSVLVTNNTFHYYGSSNSVINSTSNSNFIVKNLTFRNNILINSSAGSSGCSGCTFENNITTENQAFVFGNRSGSNNMNNTNPDLEDTSNGPTNRFDNDYRPKSSSPAINAGKDGKDIGITGGTSPTTVSSTNMPAIPQVIEMIINNTSILLNDSLEIQIKARKQE